MTLMSSFIILLMYTAMLSGCGNLAGEMREPGYVQDLNAGCRKRDGQECLRLPIYRGFSLDLRRGALTVRQGTLLVTTNCGIAQIDIFSGRTTFPLKRVCTDRNETLGITTHGSDIYVTDRMRHLVVKVDLATGKKTLIAGGNEEGWLDGPGEQALFSAPTDITTDGNNLYVADTGNHRIRQINLATREVSTIAGTGERGLEDGIGEKALFSSPQGITLYEDALYVMDGNQRIRKVSPSTREVSTVSDRMWSAASGLTIHEGKVYAAGHVSILTVDLSTGKVVTVAGGLGNIFTWSSPVTNPYAVTRVGDIIYILDTAKNYGRSGRIHKLDIATGTLSTMAGHIAEPLSGWQ